MSAVINLFGPSTVPGAPALTPTSINNAVNAALAADAAAAQAAIAAVMSTPNLLAALLVALNSLDTAPKSTPGWWNNGGQFAYS